MDRLLGNFEVNKEFDALLIDLNVTQNTSGILIEHTIEELVQKFIYLGDDRNIKQVYVKGKLVKC